jgi:ribosomal protein S18 acetylase RimI-like enzyme
MPWSIQPASEQTLSAALSLFLRGLVEPTRSQVFQEFFTLAQQGHLVTRHFALLFDSMTPIEAIHFEVVTGQVGIVQLPCFLPQETTGKTNYLLNEMIQNHPELRFAYCLTDDSPEAHEALTQAHFRRITHMETWCVDLEPLAISETSPPPEGIIHHPQSIHDCVSLLAQTQSRSTDLPELEGIRTPEEVWRGYALVAPQESSWWMHSREGEPVALAIVDQRQSHRWGLAYLGILPTFRQKGIGSLILSRILAKAKSAGVKMIDLLVDSRNIAAKHLYASQGFRQQISRPIYLRIPNR